MALASAVMLAGVACTAPRPPTTASTEAPASAALAAQDARPEAPLIAGRSLSGEPIDLKALRGQVVVINAWGSWCSPCRDEAPALQAVNRQMTPQGVRFIGINTRDRDPASARAFEARYGLSFPSVYDPPGDLLLRFPPHTLNPQVIPSTVIVDRRGRIAASVPGPVTATMLRHALNEVLGEKP
ncbi:TlpA family protein disulfide reductase [Streptomyces sp. NPDC058572]|uniref:TlpA family protein disulfide reductase n=1 Tax=Streptomyces sp. NPDC058572 TaxID=3346546 RepID=UPI00365F93B3